MDVQRNAKHLLIFDELRNERASPSCFVNLSANTRSGNADAPRIEAKPVAQKPDVSIVAHAAHPRFRASIKQLGTFFANAACEIPSHTISMSILTKFVRVNKVA